MLSICLCSWNDLEYLKILHKSLRKNSKVPYELLVHDNGSNDNTEQWLKENKVDYTRSESNEGVSAVSNSLKRAKFAFSVNINADMYVLPGWDLAILHQINKFKSKNIDKFTVSSCLIEPIGNNPEYSIRNHGCDAASFSEESLLRDFAENANGIKKENTVQYSHPICMKTSLWKDIGYVDRSYEYGIATDHDIAASAYNNGCRDFVMLGSSRVYHFVSKTVSKLPKNRQDGSNRFREKWGMTIDEFRGKLKVKSNYE